MPAPLLIVPKTHTITVNMRQALTHIQEALNHFSKNQQLQNLMKPAAPHEESACDVPNTDVMALLQPPTGMDTVQYQERWFDTTRYIRLTHMPSASQPWHVLLGPSTVVGLRDDHTWTCHISPSTSRFIAAALDTFAPAPVKTRIEADVIGYIRCRGAGNADCSQFSVHSPTVQSPPPSATSPLPPELEEVENRRQLAGKTTKWKLRYLYFTRAIDALHAAIRSFNGEAQPSEVVAWRDFVKAYANTANLNQCMTWDTETNDPQVDLNCGNTLMYTLMDTASELLKLRATQVTHK